LFIDSIHFTLQVVLYKDAASEKIGRTEINRTGLAMVAHHWRQDASATFLRTELRH